MKIAILGYGTIGSVVAEVLRIHQAQIEKKVGEPVELKYVLNKRNKNYCFSSSARFSKGDFQPSTCIGMLLERFRYRFICFTKSL